MRNLAMQIHDENLDRPPKGKPGSRPPASREVLQDVTYQKKPLAPVSSSLATKKSKLPVYLSNQYKKPRLAKVRGHGDEDKENRPALEEIRSHFDDLNVDAELTEDTRTDPADDDDFVNNLDLQPPAEVEAATPESDTEPAIRPPNHVPMEPRWDRSIYEELQYVVRKYQRVTLDEDDEDTYDVTMVAEYAPEIFNYMRELETRLAPDPRYMDHQHELKWDMRRVLIDWVVQVHTRFNLLPETLFLTVNYIDRFLLRRVVLLSKFQLVGAVALFIAAKYEEINCPTVQEVAYMADNAYSVDEFLKAERFMIGVLDFDMGWPGPMLFLRRTSKADDYDYETRTLAKYFLEITIVDSRFVALPPLWLAAGAHYLLRQLLNKGKWSELHVFYLGYTEDQLRPLADALLSACYHPEQHHKAIYEKYQERRYRRLSAFVQEYLHNLK